MFEHATATADSRHRMFFARAGEICQVWARRTDGILFYLPDGGVDREVRAAAHAGRLTCPYPGCPDPRFIAKGGSERRHHFAHRIAGQEHRTTAAWRHQALLMLADWSARRYPNLEIELDDREAGESLQLRSPRTGRVVRLTVTYDRRYQPPPPLPGVQLLVGHSRGLLLPRREAEGAPGRWWCGEGRLVGDLVADRGWALAVNPEERLIATIAEPYIARGAGLTEGRPRAALLCIVDELEHAHLDADGIHTPASNAIDRELDRRQAAETEHERSRREAAAQARARQAEIEGNRADAQARPDAHAPSPSAWPTHHPAGPALTEEDRDWPRDPETLRRLLNDDDLARRLEQPLGSDAECDVPAAVWHLMAVLEWRKRGNDAHPLAIRAAIVQNGCGYSLTGDAIAGVLAIARGET
jgi:hypothetical protein